MKKKKSKSSLFTEFDQYFEQNRLDQLLLRIGCSFSLSNKFVEYLHSSINDNDLKRFVDFCSTTEDGAAYLYNFSDNKVLRVCFDRKILALQEVLDFFEKHKDVYAYVRLYENLCKLLSERNESTKEAAQHLLALIESEQEGSLDEDDINQKFEQLDQMLASDVLVTELVTNDLLTYSRIKEYDDVILNQSKRRPLSESWYMSEIAEFPSITLNVIDYYAYNEKIFEYIEQYKMSIICAHNDEQFSELLRVLQNSEKARKNLRDILDNNLLDQYVFESLISLLAKDTEKKKIKFNF